MSDTGKAVFLSYASQDAAPARRICETLRAAGVEVWFDQSELVGGDAWDAKIRKQIKDCALFVPVISANTNARLEGYFRREWRMAVERMHDMDDDMPFLVPVVIDDTPDAAARVPERFRERQWTRLPGGETPPVFCERVTKLLGGSEVGAASAATRMPAESRNATKVLPGRKLPWLVPAIVVLVVIAALAFWRPWSRSPGSMASTPIASEADQLVRQARELLYDYSAARHEFALADDLLTRATTLAPNSAAAWGASALTHFFTFFRAYDTNRERLTRSRAAAEKALRLDPANVDALLALGLQRQEQGETARAKELFDRALTADPQNPRVLIAQSILIPDRRARADFLVDAAQRVERPAELYLYAGLGLMQVRRFREAVALYDLSFAAEPFWRTYVVRAFAEYSLSADPQKVEAWLEHIPELRADEPRVAIMRYKAAMLRRDGPAAARALEPLTADFIEDNYYIGPKSFLLAQAHEIGGSEALAREQWQAAERIVRERLAAEPGNTYWRSLLAVILTGEQRTDEARAAAEACAGEDRRVGAVGGSRLSSSMQSIENTAQAFMRLGDTARAIEVLRAAPYDQYWGYVSSATLAADPMWGPLRGQPGYAGLQAILKKVEQPAGAGQARAPASVPDDKSVAVLAFANLSDDKANEYFSDGISEELLNVLAKVPGLKVTARTSSFYFKGRNVPIPEIAQKLGVAYVVEGSVRKQGEKVRITAQLIKAADGFHVWSDNFNRDLQDIFAVQDEIAGLIAQQLQLKLGGAARKAAPIKPEAFELYVQARRAWNLRSAAGFAQAEQLLTRALMLEPDFARAHVALADVWMLRAIANGVIDTFGQRQAPVFTQIVSQIEKALALDPESSEARASLGLSVRLRQWNLSAAERELRRAVELNPNYATAHHWLGNCLLESGQVDEGVAELRLAAELDPFSLRILESYAQGLVYAGSPGEALAVLGRAEALQARSPLTRFLKAEALLQIGRRAEAIATARELDPEDRAELLARAGEKAEAEAALAEAEGWVRYQLLSALGRTADALASLRADDVPVTVVGDWLLDPGLDPFRQDPHFVQLLATLGLTEAHARIQAWRAAQPPEIGGQKTESRGQK